MSGRRTRREEVARGRWCRTTIAAFRCGHPRRRRGRLRWRRGRAVRPWRRARGRCRTASGLGSAGRPTWVSGARSGGPTGGGVRPASRAEWRRRGWLRSATWASHHPRRRVPRIHVVSPGRRRLPTTRTEQPDGAYIYLHVMIGGPSDGRRTRVDVARVPGGPFPADVLGILAIARGAVQRRRDERAFLGPSAGDGVRSFRRCGKLPPDRLVAHRLRQGDDRWR